MACLVWELNPHSPRTYLYPLQLKVRWVKLCILLCQQAIGQSLTFTYKKKTYFRVPFSSSSRTQPLTLPPPSSCDCKFDDLIQQPYSLTSHASLRRASSPVSHASLRDCTTLHLFLSSCIGTITHSLSSPPFVSFLKLKKLILNVGY